MAVIPPFVATTTFEGQDLNVKASSAIFWVPVGRGKVTSFAQYEVGIAGKLSVLGYEGDLDILLQLTDEDVDAKEGVCRLQLNSHVDESARYSVHVRKQMLVVDAVLGGKKQQVAIGRCNDGEQTECRLKGEVSQLVHLEPR